MSLSASNSTQTEHKCNVNVWLLCQNQIKPERNKVCRAITTSYIQKQLDLGEKCTQSLKSVTQAYKLFPYVEKVA